MDAAWANLRDQVRADQVAQVDKAARDQVRAAQHLLASRLRVLALEAQDVAVQLEMADAAERISSRVHGRYASVRDAITGLEAARRGAAVMRREVRRAT